MTAGISASGGGFAVRVVYRGIPANVAEEVRLLSGNRVGEGGFVAVKAMALPQQLMRETTATLEAAGLSVAARGSLSASGSVKALIWGGSTELANGCGSLRERGGDFRTLGDDIAVAVTRAAASLEVPEGDCVCAPPLRRMYGDVGRKTLVMGILNVTPDSFSDGGRFWTPESAVEHGIKLAAEGADIVDVGGESTRPGAEPVTVQEELDRVLPVIGRLAASVEVPVSVDTSKAEVAELAIQAGATMINDVTGLIADPEVADVAAKYQAALVIMHMRGLPRTMQQDTDYDDLMDEVYCFLDAQMSVARDRGLANEWMIVDPGFGFGKTPEQNMWLLNRLSEFRALGRPVMVGTSRKSTLARAIGGAPALERMEATAATVAIAVANGANIVRVHDVREMVRVLRTAEAVMEPQRLSVSG